MFTGRLSLVLAALFLLAVGASAAPIPDGSYGTHRVGWYPNVSEGEGLTCPQTCRAHMAAVAESAPSPGVPSRAFVCKVQVERGAYLFGSQFDDRPACYTVGLDLKGAYHERYHCLCVDPKVEEVKPGESLMRKPPSGGD
jgi:hypothetical protein